MEVPPRPATPGLRRVEQIMGLPIAVDVRDVGVDPASLDTAFDWFRWVDVTFSTYREDSQMSLLNRHELTLDDLEPEVREVLTRCEELCAETDGYFDAHTDHLPVPVIGPTGLATRSGIDPSGLVKGWSVDRAAAILDEAGAVNYSINAGGDVRVRGGALPQSHWRVGIRHPLLSDKLAGVVAVTNASIATSGTYERGAHIIDPHTGAPPSGVLSVSIVGPHLATADAYATAAFAMGTHGPEWTAQLFGYDAMTILEDETVLSTRWFPRVVDALP